MRLASSDVIYWFYTNCVSRCRDFVAFGVVFIVSLTVGAEVAIASGVAVSWLLTLALPYGTTFGVHVLAIQSKKASQGRRSSASSAPEFDPRGPVVRDVFDAREEDLAGLSRVAVLGFRSTLMFSSCDKLKVWIILIYYRREPKFWTH